jgi:DNA modification methylase
MTSPPYWGLRDYDVDGQIGLEDSLAEYIEELVAVGDALRRVLRDDGSWWLNLGDSYNSAATGSQPDGEWARDSRDESQARHKRGDVPLKRKSKMLVPHRVAIALQDAGWVVRSDGPWVKPNPMPHPVKDRLREDKEFVFHLTPEPDYWFDLDAIREPHKDSSLERGPSSFRSSGSQMHGSPAEDGERESVTMDQEDALHPNGKNPGDVLEISVKPFPEAHFAVYPPELCETPIKSSCPEQVCAECGTPYERESEVVDREVGGGAPAVPGEETGYSDRSGNHQGDYHEEGFTQPTKRYIGPWHQQCDCPTDETEPGIVLDPFAGAGTTCLVAKRLGRRFIGVDLNPEYVAMAQKRVGVTVDEPERLLDEGETHLAAFADGGEP